MGEIQAAIAVAAIYERTDQITSAGVSTQPDRQGTGREILYLADGDGTAASQTGRKQTSASCRSNNFCIISTP
ncbi:hypothetical protein [Aquamicrobium sp. NLF2-7]|uniref:hypothetical protein n=1 Tax=Aquamicrobium sp. NLF2-7 TaxID=2918753 RepID=UPI0023BAB995|nr:hypothetical protein [Aquamicrobium sp. NLF2-7]